MTHLKPLAGILVSVLFAAAGAQDQDYAYQRDQAYWMKLGKEDVLKALSVQQNNGIAKNVIIFVGDGMGPNTVTAARIFRQGESSSLSFENFPVVGLSKTYAVDSTVPDSACTATAIFSGVKSNFETVGVDGRVNLTDCEAAANKSTHVSSIMQWAQDAGKATGFVTTTRVTHATPSSLYGHSADRRWECDNSLPPTATQCKDLARQLIEDEPGRNLQVIMGGGRQTLKSGGLSSGDKKMLNVWDCARTDGRDLIEEWKQDKISRQVSHQVVRNTGDLKNLDWRTQYVMGIFSNSHMPYDDERDTSDSGTPSLADMTRTSIEVLQKNGKGFVLMVEGGMIDQAHHRGLIRRAMVETVRFHEAVEVALDMTNSSDTLIIVTADHAHGLTINGKTKINQRNNIMGTTANQIEGIPINILSYVMGGKDMFPYTSEEGKVVRKNPDDADNSKPDYKPQAGYVADEVIHSGVDVAIYAKGPMAHLLAGVNEQTHIAHVIAYAARIGQFKEDRSHAAAVKSTAPVFMVSLTAIALCIAQILYI